MNAHSIFLKFLKWKIGIKTLLLNMVINNRKKCGMYNKFDFRMSIINTHTSISKYILAWPRLNSQKNIDIVWIMSLYFIIIKSPHGSPLKNAKVGFLIISPDGTKQKVMAMAMGSGKR